MFVESAANLADSNYPNHVTLDLGFLCGFLMKAARIAVRRSRKLVAVGHANFRHWRIPLVSKEELAVQAVGSSLVSEAQKRPGALGSTGPGF